MKSFFYFAPSLAPPPQLPKLPYLCRLCQPSLFTSTVPFLYPNPKTFSKHRESSDESYQNRTLQLHSTFCSPFSSLELSTAISQLSTSSGSDQITYPLLTHLPQSALHFLLYIFNLSWSTHTFPSTWKQSTIIPILKPGKSSHSPSSYRTISLTSCTSKLFERMVLGRLTNFLEQQDILSPVRAGFRPGRLTVDQVLLLSQSIADSFYQSKPGARAVLATVDFLKTFDSVWHSALLSKLLSLDLPLCFVEWIRSYLSDRRSKVRICN